MIRFRKPAGTTRPTSSSCAPSSPGLPTGSRETTLGAAPSLFDAIWDTVATIPRGRVATYGQIARMVGLRNGARTVGWAMRAAPDGERRQGAPVPWHRVLNAQGRISPRGDHGAEAARQAHRLRREGIVVSRSGSVDLERYLWSGLPRGRSGP